MMNTLTLPPALYEKALALVQEFAPDGVENGALDADSAAAAIWALEHSARTEEGPVIVRLTDAERAVYEACLMVGAEHDDDEWPDADYRAALAFG